MKAIRLLVVLFALCVACNRKSAHDHAENSDVIYVCSMDPQVRESKPGNCPICHMPLTPVKRTALEAEGVIELSEQQIRLGGITTDTVGYGNIGTSQTLTGTLVENPENITSVNARVDGRIEQLYVKATGEAIRKGQPLYRLYSEELYNTQRDYLNALRREDSVSNDVLDFGLVAQSAKNKLLLWGVSEQQIHQLELSGEPLTSFDIYSPSSGIVTELFKREGEYVMIGEAVMRVADYSTLWVESNLYAYNKNQFQDQQTVYVLMPDGETIASKISFVAPQTSDGSQLMAIRMTVPNEKLTYRPGVAVTVTAVSNFVRSLTIPKNAILYDEMGASVWVKTGERKFEIRMVEPGNESGNTIEIKNGLVAGDEIVISGVYLLNSEYVFRKGTQAHDHAM